MVLYELTLTLLLLRRTMALALVDHITCTCLRAIPLLMFTTRYAALDVCTG